MSRNFLVAVVVLLALCGLPSSAWGQALPGDLLVAEFTTGTVVEVSAGGDVSAAPPFATGLSGPTHLCVGPGGDVFVTEFSSGEVTIITAGGAAPTAFATGLNGPIALSCSGSEVLVSEFFDGEVTDITAGGSFAGPGAFATGLGTPVDLYRDSGGTLWVADRDGRVLDISAGGDFNLAPGFATAPGFLFGLGEDDADLLVAQNDPSDPNAPDDRAVIAFTAGGDLGLLARTPVTAPEDILHVPGLGLFVSEVDGNGGRIYEISGGYAVGAPFATGIAGGAGFAGMVYIEGCPDGIVQGAEECDDDNATDGDGCTSACIEEVCGDGITQAGLGEECDDGNLVSGDGCTSACIEEVCGDGITQAGLGEECDDGNGTEGDGCSAICVVEFCGDGMVDAGLAEQCDDGNAVSEDGCSALCVDEFCGDSVIQGGLGEVCDDGNMVAGDGCSDACLSESCGDGAVQPGLGEECDDGAMVSGDGCSEFCLDEFCGDGITQAGLGEACDDGNTTEGDGCSATCVVEFCGDGMVDAGLGEQCDDGNTASGDGCSAACVGELCGDGILEASLGEVCDDGNVLDGDGCAADCMRATYCEPTPDPVCAIAEKGLFDIDERKAGKEKLKLGLKKLATETLPGDLGDPAGGSTSYEICIYDGAGDLIENYLVDRAGETCGDKGKDCWKPTKRGFKFKDVDASSDGIRSIDSKAGAEGKGQVKAAGKNNAGKGQAALPTGLASALFLSPQVEVQVVTSDAQCFGATLTTSRADGSRYKAKK